MAEIRILSNVLEASAHFRERAEAYPEAIEKAVAKNAQIALKETIVQIDALIYSTPDPMHNGAIRTKHLRRSNAIKKLGKTSWLLYNDASYAVHVHNGTSHMSPRPWMKTGLDVKSTEMRNNLVEAGIEVFSR